MKDFAAWLNEVDRWVGKLSGLSIHDLADVALADWHDDGVAAKAAARRALKNEGWEWSRSWKRL